ncbi:MAG: M24B family metallopeptidase, partial [Rhodospirillaceae bacterium]
ATTTARTEDLLSEAGVTMTRGADPCVLPRATKNPVELEGTRDAHRRDGLALTKFLHWLSRFGAGPDGAPTGLTEQGAADRLEQFRREDPSLRDLSFDTIAGFGANGAIVHYRVSPETDKPLEAGELFLVDSGGQYPDGTTDVTRTVAIGADAVPPDAERIKRYTQVLKGHVALGMASFPEGTTGAQLDTLARTALWADGVDYDHGTGHGVGSYLGVHEGPARISKAGSVPLQPGMILSNEPGYYKTGAFGIRIENLVVVHQQDAMPGGEKPMLCFETLTLAPYDRALIDPSLLTQAERDWVDAYQAHVFQFHAPHLSPEAADWLAAVTAPLGNDPMVDSPEEALPAFDRQRSAS